MDIYFVRHGQTLGNVAKRHQAEHTELSALGEEQAKLVANEVKALKPTHLISSHLVRAIATARYIAQSTNLEMEVDHMFAELQRPRYLHGRLHYGPTSVFYYFLWFFGIENRQLAGESYKQFRERIALARNRLSQYPPDAQIIVVSHSVFINLFLAHMCRPRRLSLFKLIGFVSKILTIPNASIVHVSYDPNNNTGCKWRRVES